MGATAFALFIFGGFFLLMGWLDWDGFFEGWRMIWLTELMGRETARKFILILGAMFTAGGFLVLL